MSRVLRQLKIKFLGRLNETKGALLPAWKSSMGESPPASFESLIKTYLHDPAARAAIDFITDQAAGAGFYTTAEVAEAKAFVDEFNESVNLDGLLLQTVQEIVAFGNSFWEKIEPERLEALQILPLTSIDRIQRDNYGVVKAYRQTMSYGGNLLEPRRKVHFCWNQMGGEAFGTGILRSLAESLSLGNGETRPGYAVMNTEMEKRMRDIIAKYAGPTEIWKFPGISDEKASQYAALIKGMPREGARFVVNTPEEVEVVTGDMQGRFDAYIEYMWNQYILGLQIPLPKLFTTPGFTEASAKAAIEVAERKVQAIQRFVKRIVERYIFVPVVS